MDFQEEKKRLMANIASLESKLDFFETEFGNLNEMLEECGFQGGIQTLKSTVKEVLDEISKEINKDPLEEAPSKKQEEEEA